MKNTDNNLRGEIILLTTKALDLLNKALDLLATDENPSVEPRTESNSSAECRTETNVECRTENVESATANLSAEGTAVANSTLKQDTYRANAIRFNDQYLRDHYTLRYNTMLKTTEFHPRNTETTESRIDPKTPGLPGNYSPPWGGVKAIGTI